MVQILCELFCGSKVILLSSLIKKRVRFVEFVLMMQIENYNKPFLGALSEYDDGKDLSDYDFGQDGLGLPSDDDNKRKLAYMHRVIAQKYEKV